MPPRLKRPPSRFLPPLRGWLWLAFLGIAKRAIADFAERGFSPFASCAGGRPSASIGDAPQITTPGQPVDVFESLGDDQAAV